MVLMSSMTESKYLAGKVSKWSLPIVEDPPGPYKLKRLMLPQGELANIYDSDEGIRFLTFLELRAGSVRGNHYHKVKEEFVYVTHGEVSLVVQDIDSKARDLVQLRTGDIALIHTRVAHALQTTQAGQALEFSKTRFDADDCYRFPLT